MMAANMCFHSMQAATNSTELIPAPLPRVTAAIPTRTLSHSTLQIIQLTRSGIDEGVVLSFIENSATFDLTADHIIYLNNLGVSIRTLNAMLAHDREVFSRTNHSVVTNRLATVQDASTLTRQGSDPTDPLNQTITSQSPAPIINQREGIQPQTSVVSTQSQTGMRAVVEFAEPTPPNARSASPRPITKKANILYPVREPYPVELTIPIVLLDYPTF